MPEFLLATLVVGAFALVKYQQIRFIFSHFKRSCFRDKPARTPVDPYRNNTEVERDSARRRADKAEAAVSKLENELAEIRMERDLALQQRALTVLKGRLSYGGVFALGALTCFTSVNVTPQIVHDMLAERPTYAPSTRPPNADRMRYRDDLMIGLLTMGQRHHPYGACAPETCCPRSRIRLVAFGEFVLRYEPATLPIAFYWSRVTEPSDMYVFTSGGEETPSEPSDSQPTWIERYALPAGRDTSLLDIVPMAITITLD